MKSKLFLVLIVFTYLILAASILRRGHDWGDDFASYIMQAQSIRDGNMDAFVARNSFTIFESSIQIGPVAYPWGYPLSLVPVLFVRGVHPLVLKLPGIFFYIGFLFCLYSLTKNRFTLTESLLIVSLFAFNPMMIDFTDQILSDIPFLFFSTLTLTLMLIETRRRWMHSFLIGVCIALAFFIRTQGLLLLAAYFFVQFMVGWKYRNDKQYLTSLFQETLGCVAGVVLLIGIIALKFPGGSESYLAQYSAFRLDAMFNFVGRYFWVFSEFFGAGLIWQIIYCALFVFFLIGAWTRRENETIFVVFFGIWMLFLITWPYWQGIRFIFPLLPIFIYFVFRGFKSTIAKLPVRYQAHGYIATNIFWLAIVLFFLASSTRNAYVNLKDDRSIGGPFDGFSGDMFSFIRENTPADSVVVFFKPRAMRLFTDRDSVMVLECDRLTLGDYVAIHKKWENSQVPPDQIEECGLPLQSVFENRRFIVYKILK